MFRCLFLWNNVSGRILYVPVRDKQICLWSAADLLQMCRQICRQTADHLQNVCRISAEYLHNVCSDDLQQVCKFADALQTKSAYHVKQRAHKMHHSNNVYLKDRQRRPVCHSSKVNMTRLKMLGDAGHKKTPR